MNEDREVGKIPCVSSKGVYLLFNLYLLGQSSRGSVNE